MGGGDKIRPLWRHYLANTDVIIFMVDSNDRERLAEAAEDLQKFLIESDELKDAKFLILANKQDLPNACSVSEICEKMKLHMIRDKQWYIQACCATTGDGLYEGLEWAITGVAGKTLPSSESPYFTSLKDVVSKNFLF